MESSLIGDHSNLQRRVLCRIEDKGQAGTNTSLIHHVDRDFVEPNGVCNIDGKILAVAQLGEGHSNIEGPSSRRKANIWAVDQAANAPCYIDRAAHSLMGIADDEQVGHPY